MPVPNAAIRFQTDAFNLSGQKLMGRMSASHGFLRGFARHSPVDRLYCWSGSRAEFQAFVDLVRDRLPAGRSAHWVPAADPWRLAEPGCVFLADPNLAEAAWPRRMVGDRSYSLCGITHTVSSAGASDLVGNLLLAPVQPWDALICTSEPVRRVVLSLMDGYADYLTARVGPGAHCPVQLPVIPLGVDCEGFAPDPGRRAGLRQRLGIDDEALAVLFLGRLSFHAKAHPLAMFLALERAAARTGRTVHLLLSGWFANEGIAEAFRVGWQTWCPSIRVHHIDNADRAALQDSWRAADLFCSLSDNVQETFGLTPVEAMAAGLPCVVTDWNGYRDTVVDGETGFAVPTLMPPAGSGVDLANDFMRGMVNYDRFIGYAAMGTAVDVEATTAAFETLLSNPDLRGRMGAAGRRRARERFDWKVVIAAYHELWADLAERRAAAPTVAPHQAGTAAHPLRPDPFRLYGHYATRVLEPDDVLELAVRDWRAALDRSWTGALTTFSFPVQLDRADVEGLLARLEERPRRAGDLVGAEAQRSWRTIGWLIKLDLVRVRR